ncbi:hypothetical protein ACWCXB_29965 [Streptomyces sp. NPDC001514]
MPISSCSSARSNSVSPDQARCCGKRTTPDTGPSSSSRACGSRPARWPHRPNTTLSLTPPVSPSSGSRSQTPQSTPAAQAGRMATQMNQIALRVHRLVVAPGVSRVDFLIAPSGRTPVLEINTVPGRSELGNLATIARAADISHEELIVHVLDTAFTKPAYVP